LSSAFGVAFELLLLLLLLLLYGSFTGDSSDGFLLFCKFSVERAFFFDAMLTESRDAVNKKR
jgi:hypothetical protein